MSAFCIHRHLGSQTFFFFSALGWSAKCYQYPDSSTSLDVQFDRHKGGYTGQQKLLNTCVNLSHLRTCFTLHAMFTALLICALLNYKHFSAIISTEENQFFCYFANLFLSISESNSVSMNLQTYVMCAFLKM